MVLWDFWAMKARLFWGYAMILIYLEIMQLSMGYQWDITKNGVVLLPKRWEFVGPAIYTRCGALDERASFSGLINFTSWNGHIPKCLVIYKIYKCD